MPSAVYERDIPLRDLSRLDKISQTKMHDSKFFSALRKGKKITQLDHQWQLAARQVTGHRGARDGEDQSEYGKQLRIPAKMRCQEFREGWRITQKTDDTEQIAGPEKARQKAEASIRLKEKIQARLLSDATPMEESTADTADEMAGAFWWFLSAVSTYFTLPAAYRTPAGCVYSGDTLANFHESTLEGLMAEAFKSRNGGDLKLDGWLGIDLKDRIGKFAQVDTESNGDNNLRSYTFSGKDQQIIRCVDFLKFSQGTVRLHPTTYLLRDADTGASHADAHRSGLFLDMDLWSLHFMVPWAHKDNTDEGGGPRGFYKSSLALIPETVNGQLAVRCNG